MCHILMNVDQHESQAILIADDIDQSLYQDKQHTCILRDQKAYTNIVLSKPIEYEIADILASRRWLI